MKDTLSPSQIRVRSELTGGTDDQFTSSILFPKSALSLTKGNHQSVLTDALHLGDTGIILGRVISGGHEVLLEDPLHVTILIPTKGHILMEACGESLRFDSGDVAVVTAAKRRTRVVAANCGLSRRQPS